MKTTLAEISAYATKVERRKVALNAHVSSAVKRVKPHFLRDARHCMWVCIGVNGHRGWGRSIRGAWDMLHFEERTSR